jgi:single-strand DNA-binding protein
LNKVMLIGHLGRDPEMRYTQNGTPVAQFSVAASSRWKDAGGETKESTEWFNVVAWSKLAETCNQYLSKGSKVYVEGRLQTRSWEKEGQKHYRTEVVAGTMLMLDSKKNGPAALAEEDMPF